MTRDSVSRPTWSVPNVDWASGGLFIRRKSVLSGSFGATHGANSAIKMMRIATIPPTADSGLRRTKAASSPRTERSISVPDPGIEPGVGHVHEHVDEDEDRRVEQHEVLDHDDVSLDD